MTRPWGPPSECSKCANTNMKSVSTHPRWNRVDESSSSWRNTYWQGGIWGRSQWGGSKAGGLLTIPFPSPPPFHPYILSLPPYPFPSPTPSPFPNPLPSPAPTLPFWRLGVWGSAEAPQRVRAEHSQNIGLNLWSVSEYSERLHCG